MRLVPKFLLLLTVSCSTTQFYRAMLSLVPFCKMKEPEHVASYVVQKMISLFSKNHSDSPGAVILRTTVLMSAMEERGGVIVRLMDFENMITVKSEGLLSGVMKGDNVGARPPIELISLFQGDVQKAMGKFLRSSLDTVLNVKPFKNLMKLEDWLLHSILDAAIAWKHFRFYFAFVQCDKRLFDLDTSVSALNENMLDLDDKLSELDTTLYDLKDSAFDLSKSNSDSESIVETRLRLYLNRYEKFLKPRVLRFKIESSYAIVVAVFNFFQYLHQISRVYARNLSEEIVERLQHEHGEFTLKATAFAGNITTTERTLVRSLPFDGWWYFKSSLDDGLLVPSKLHSLSLSLQYVYHKSLVKVSMYNVSSKPRKELGSLGMIRLHAIDDQSMELIWYTSEEDGAELEKFVRKIGKRSATYIDLIHMI